MSKRKKRRKIETSYPQQMFKYVTDNAEMHIRNEMTSQYGAGNFFLINNY